MLRAAQPPSKLLLRCSRKTFAAEAGKDLKRTVLHDFHVQNGGKMVPFCGWSMPLQYKEGIIQSHTHTRTNASLFDVSHMGQLNIRGKDRVEFMERLTVGDVAALEPNHAKLSLFTNEKGGIKDDTVISNHGDHLYVVINAGCTDKDLLHIREHESLFKNQGKDVAVEHRTDLALLALQGPKAVTILSKMVKEDLSTLKFMSGRKMDVAGISCLVTRCGYTGEDGFEISVSSQHAVKLAQCFIEHEEVLLAGLGARDSLRLEAGLCLYGNDIEEDTSPIEAALLWTIGKRRREEGGFLGDAVILKQIRDGVSRKRVGLVMEKGIARDGAVVFGADGSQVGKVTSGLYGPSVKQGIAMAYLNLPHNKTKTAVQVNVRDKLLPAVVSKMPFYPSNYYKG